jgi:hypothetical protein
VATISNRPATFVTSAVAGAVGVVLILLGAVLGSNAVFFAGYGAGVISLIAALMWRAELVTAWRTRR